MSDHSEKKALAVWSARDLVKQAAPSKPLLLPHDSDALHVSAGGEGVIGTQVVTGTAYSAASTRQGRSGLCSARISPTLQVGSSETSLKMLFL